MRGYNYVSDAMISSVSRLEMSMVVIQVHFYYLLAIVFFLFFSHSDSFIIKKFHCDSSLHQIDIKAFNLIKMYNRQSQFISQLY